MAWHRPGGATQEHINKYVTEVASLVNACQIPTFSRTRWLRSATPVTQVTLLLCCHNLGRRALLRTLDDLVGQPLAPVSVSDKWGVESDDEEDKEDGGEEADED